MRTLFVFLLLAAQTAMAAWDETLYTYKKAMDAVMEPKKSAQFENVIMKEVHGVCDVVKQDAGYITVEKEHNYFFWFFESRQTPERDPLLIWLTGGPGCSSQIALFKENGPCQLFGDGVNTQINPFGWNARHNIIFIDQPTGVGFSYGPETEKDEETVAKHLYTFMIEFLKSHPKFKASDFYITGESYAGHYIPHFGRFIVEMNQAVEGVQNREASEDLTSKKDAHTKHHGHHQKKKKAHPRRHLNKPDTMVSSKTDHFLREPLLSEIPFGEEPFTINFKGVAIGNGLTDPLHQYPSYPYYAYNNNHNRLISRSEFHYITENLIPKCVQDIQACADEQSLAACKLASEFCTKNVYLPAIVNNINIYDVRIKCEVPGLCYNFEDIVQFVNRPEFVQQIGANPKQTWAACNMDVNKHFATDRVLGFESDIKYLLENGVNTLIYAGDADYICNWMSNRAWIYKLDWAYHTEFASAPLQEFQVDGITSSEYTQYKNLTFMRVFEAGHMVPMDQPKVALEIISAFTFNHL